MRGKRLVLFLKLTSGFFINLSAAYFFAIYVAPGFLEKVNALLSCGLCFGAAYYIEWQYNK